jgi:plastocyanin
MPILRSKVTAVVLAATTIPMPLYLIGARRAAAATSPDRATHSQSRRHAGKHHAKRHHRVDERHAPAKRQHRIDVHHARAGEPAAHPRAPANPRRRVATASGNYGSATTASGPGTSAARPTTSPGVAGGAARQAARSAQGKSWRLAFPGARAAKRVKAHAANDPADTISDFKFTPGTLTIHIGDSVTWTNDGPTDHTATANDGSFDTGTLKKGQSASHTFTKAGTFAYICAIHPFMKGTIVVQASTTSASTPSTTSGSGTSGPSSGTSGTSSGTSGTTSGTSGTRSGTSAGGTGDTGSSTTSTPGSSGSGAVAPATNSTLPVTGLDLTAAVLCGLGLIALGLVLRMRLRNNPQAGRS